MNIPRFIERQNGQYYEYHLPTDYGRFIRKSIFQTGSNLDKNLQENIHSFFWKNGITSSTSNENALLYYITLSCISKNKSCFLIYFDNESEIETVQNRAPRTMCEWRFSIEYIEGYDFCNSFGIVNPAEFLHLANYSDKDLSNRYFYLSKVDSVNLQQYAKLYHSDVTDWFFIFCQEDKEVLIKDAFTNKSYRPSLDFILENTDCLANIQIGGDEGYLDYILVQAKNEMRNLIVEAESKMEKFITEYEKLLIDIGVIDDEWKVDFYKERFNEIMNLARHT